MSFPVQHFPAVSSINLFNLGSFLFLAELYHNLSAETIRSIQLDRSDGRRIFLCFILLEAFPYGLSTTGFVSVACCGKGEKAYWIFLAFFLAEIANRILENAQKKGVLVFGFKVLSVFFFFWRNERKSCICLFYFILHCNCIYCSVRVENLHVVTHV